MEGLSGVYIASQIVAESIVSLKFQHLASVITFDHGITWHPIEPPAYDVEGHPTNCSIKTNCSLHLSLKFSFEDSDTRSVSILSTRSTPGVILATGVLGENLKGQHRVYISMDGGLTWKQTLSERYFYNIGDHGGILTAVKYSEGETRDILYSVNEGGTWEKIDFHNRGMHMYALMTEPGEKSTAFTTFGSLPGAHNWIIVKVDFHKIFSRTCTEVSHTTTKKVQKNLYRLKE